MAQYRLDGEEFNATYNQINKAANSDVIDAIQGIAGILKPHKDDAEIFGQAYENCVALAKSYNDGGFYDSLCGLKKTFDELFDLSEYMEKKANIGSVSSADTSFKSGGFDASGVMV